MAKKKVKNMDTELSAVISDEINAVDNKITEVDTKCIEDDMCVGYNSSYNGIEHLSIFELINYYEACKIICIQYEKEINLNELEKRNYTPDVIKYNREKYQKFTSIHRRLREIIEHKVEKLTEYEGW